MMNHEAPMWIFTNEMFDEMSIYMSLAAGQLLQVGDGEPLEEDQQHPYFRQLSRVVAEDFPPRN